MATNVTEKDKTLNEIIDWYEQMESDGLRLASALLIQHDMVTLDPPPDLVEIAEDLDAMRTAEAVSLLFILFCRDPQFRRSLYKLDPVLFRRFTNGEVWL